MKTATPHEILSHYPITPIKIESITGGIIHDTLKVTAVEGLFILQKVSPIFKPSVMEDRAAVLQHLRSHGFETEQIVYTHDGKHHVPDAASFWRVFTYIQGASVSTITHPQTAFAAGAFLGRVHCSLQSLVHDFKHVRSVKHNIPALFGAYKTATAGKLSNELKELAAPIDLLLELAPPSTLRTCVTHGDPKINNFIFRNKDAHDVVSMIDLDDCGNQYTPVIELANAFRSWCQVADDAPENAFNIQIFEHGLRGYVEGSQHFLNDEEWDWLSNAIKLLPLELASRWLRDAFEDTYFTWDSTRFASRYDHNMARFKSQMQLYADICRQEDSINAIIAYTRNLGRKRHATQIKEVARV